MDRRNFLALTLSITTVTLIAGCGGGSSSSIVGGTSGGTSGVTSVSGRLVLPAGVSLEGMKAHTLLGVEAVKSDGSFSVSIKDNGPTLSVAQGKSTKPVLYGFARTGRADLSPRTTAEVLVFMASGAIYAPGVMHPVFVEQLSQPGILAATEKAISDLILAHGESWMETPSAELKAAIIEDSRAFRPTNSRKAFDQPTDKVTRSIVQPADKVSGITVESDGVGTTYLTNYFRRRASYYVSRESYKDSTGATRASFQKIVDPSVSLSPIKGATNALITIAEFAGGARDFLLPVKSDAIILPLTPAGATSTLYKVTAVGLGATPGDFDKLDPQQQADWADTALRTLVIDFIVPILTGLILPKMGEKIDDLLKFFHDGATGTFIKDIINAIAAQPDIISKAKAGNITEATYDGFLVLTGSETLKLGLFKALYEFLSLLDNGKIDFSGFMGNALERANALLGGIDLVLQGIDSAFQFLDIARSQNATQWDVTITKPKLTLTPAATTVSPGGRVGFTARVLDADVAETLITYRWSLTGKGSLINPVNSATGTTLDTSGGTVNFEAPFMGITDNEKATLIVEAFAGGINDPNRRSLGTMTAEVTLKAVLIYGEAAVDFSSVILPSDPADRLPIEFVGGSWTRSSPVSLTTFFGKTICPPSFDGPGPVGVFGLRTGIAFDFATPLEVGKTYPLELGTAHNYLALKWTTSGNVENFAFYEGSVTLTEIQGKRVSFTLTASCRNSGTPETNPRYYGATVNASGWFLLA